MTTTIEPPHETETGTGTGTEAEAGAGLSVAQRFAVITEQLAALAEVEAGGLASAEILEAIDAAEQARRRLEAVTLGLFSAAEADGMWATTGARSFPSWVAARTGRHTWTARRQVTHARRLRDDLPATTAALRAGQIGTDHADVIARYASATETLKAQLADPEIGEEFLVEQAKVLDAHRFSRLVRAWATRADPDAADRNWREDTAREEVSLSATLNGYQLRGWLSPANGQLLDEALRARMGTPSANDPRTPTQRRANALTGLAHLALDSGTLKPGARIRPHLAVHVSHETLTHLIQATHPNNTDTDGAGSAGSGSADLDSASSTGSADLDSASSTGSSEVDTIVVGGAEVDNAGGASAAGGSGATAIAQGAAGTGTAAGMTGTAGAATGALHANHPNNPNEPSDTSGANGANGSGGSNESGDAGGSGGSGGSNKVNQSSGVNRSDGSDRSGQAAGPIEPARSALVPAGQRPDRPPGDVPDGIIIPAGVDNTVMTGTEPATLTDGTPISPRQLARLACQSQIYRVIFGPDGEVLDSGREQRLFTPGQTRAIIARDRHCVFPDCNAPPGEGEIHHSLWWYDQYGPTRVDLGLLVCWHHHDHIHAHDIAITRRNGQWIFTRTDGTEIRPTRPH